MLFDDTIYYEVPRANENLRKGPILVMSHSRGVNKFRACETVYHFKVQDTKDKYYDSNMSDWKNGCALVPNNGNSQYLSPTPKTKSKH